MNELSAITSLQKRIEALEQENAMLRRDFNSLAKGNSVIVPDEMKPVFDMAQLTVGEYFRDLKMDPSKGTIEIHDQRYVLVRASTLSKDFLDTVQHLYADRGTAEAFAIGKNFLFDISHVIGMNDARNFHTKMNLTDPISKLSAGPVHFAYSGWAFVDILPESNPTPDDDFYLVYHHPYSFEADSWKRAGKVADVPICIMNTGYSSGWCEESFGIPLTAVEVSCTGRGDEHCTFIMAPPHKIQEHLDRFHRKHTGSYKKQEQYEVPTFFDRKRVEEEMQRSKLLAEESAKSKTDFVANMSHELRTPLSAILGFSDLLSRTVLNPEQKDYLEAINSSGNNLLSVINDILDLSKLDAGKFGMEQVRFRIPALVQTMRTMFAHKAKEKGLEFSCGVDTGMDMDIIGDPKKLTQILINLIGNAIKFTEKGSVRLDCRITKQQDKQVEVCFLVKDTGIGIPDAKQQIVFERFAQADTDITRRYGGTGLGLAITRQLVGLQGGTILLESKEGEGAAFSFTLPYIVADEETITLPENAGYQLGCYTAKEILVVEDSIMNQKLTRIMLHNNGFNVVVAANGKEAVAILKEKSFDIILMDIQMPEMDGCQATKIIRNELHLDTPIIAMTAHALNDEKEICMKQGMNDYLAKPFMESDLLFRIRKWSRPDSTALQGKDKLIDLSFLMKQTGNNQAFVIEMITLFIDQNPVDMALLHHAIDSNDFVAVCRITHALRNSVGFFGLLPVIGDELLTIEMLSRESRDMNRIKGLYQKVNVTCIEALATLKELCSAMKA
jgi:signal transduction histidine kinase/DNA-binding response OmpR family regulator